MSGAAVVFASEGRALHTFGIDPETGALSLRATAVLPEPVQYAAVDAVRSRLYVSASDRESRHLVVALSMGARGELRALGEPIVPAAGRVIHLCVDPAGEHVLLAHPLTAQLSVVALRADGSLGRPVAQDEVPETGY